MAKKKNSVALFEVISKGRQRRVEANLEVPTWMGREAEAPLADRLRLGVPAEARPRAAAAPSKPLVSFAGERLQLSLNYVSACVAVLALLVLLAGSFALGWWGGSRQASRRAAVGPPFRPDVLGPNTPGRPARQTQPVAGSQRIKGKYYLVIQGLVGDGQEDWDEAVRIVKYCRANGEPATVARYTHPRTGRRRYIVWSLTPFDSPNSQTAQDHAGAIEQMGKRYREAGGKYNFQQRTSPDAPFDPWFEVYR